MTAAGRRHARPHPRDGQAPGRPARLHDVTVAEIAAATGVSRQLVYLHFYNRAGLLVAMARHHDGPSGFRGGSRLARSGARRGPRARCCACGCATCRDPASWRARSRRRSSPATRAAPPGATGWTTSARPCASRSSGSTAGRLAQGWTVDRRRLGVRAQPRLHLAAPRRRARLAAGRLRRAHGRLDHGRGRRPGPGRMTIGPGSIPASALSPRRRGCPLDPGPIACPAETGSGPPREQWLKSSGVRRRRRRWAGEAPFPKFSSPRPARYAAGARISHRPAVGSRSDRRSNRFTTGYVQEGG